jgi:hypothetical protein
MGVAHAPARFTKLQSMIAMANYIFGNLADAQRRKSVETAILQCHQTASGAKNDEGLIDNCVFE